MKFDVTGLRYMSKDDLRILSAVEQGMKNHELVPGELVSSIAGLKHGGGYKCLMNLLRNKLVQHDRKKYDGFRLNFLGYDFLVLHTMARRGVLESVGTKLGVGKESEVFYAMQPDGKQVAMKLHRLGRTSFRQIKNLRDYHKGRSAGWLYLSRLAALKEFAFMSVLHENGFPVPKPIECNRHAVIMELVDAHLLNSIRELRHPSRVFGKLMELMIELANAGLVHCDFNEFNLLINDEEEITLIDFPQMVSTSHPNAEMYFRRDVECLRTFFLKRFGFQADTVPQLRRDCKQTKDLDAAVAASGHGFTEGMKRDMDAILAEEADNERDEEGGGAEWDRDESDDEGEGGDESEGEGPAKAGQSAMDADQISDNEACQAEEAAASGGAGGASGAGGAEGSGDDDESGSESDSGPELMEPSNMDQTIHFGGGPRRQGGHRGGRGRGGRGGGRGGGGGAKQAFKASRNKVKNRESRANHQNIKDNM